MKRQGVFGPMLKPMLATLIDSPFDDADWIFEKKWDGFRIIARITYGAVTLFSRGGKDVTKVYPQIGKALEKIRRTAILDGELVALDKKGRSSFQLLQNAQKTTTRLRYCVFDLLYLDDEDLRSHPLIERKRLLKTILPKESALKYSGHIRKEGKRFFQKAERSGLEGIIAKRARGFYYSGKRTREWLKIKTVLRQEVVIVGFTRPRGSRRYFGSLVLALRDRNQWSYVGRAGTGFDSESLKMIFDKMKPIIGREKPFDQKVPEENLTTWIKPQLVGEVKFSEWTRDGQMRHPVFIGLRDDKRAVKVTREKAITSKGTPTWQK